MRIADDAEVHHLSLRGCGDEPDVDVHIVPVPLAEGAVTDAGVGELSLDAVKRYAAHKASGLFIMYLFGFAAFVVYSGVSGEALEEGLVPSAAGKGLGYAPEVSVPHRVEDRKARSIVEAERALVLAAVVHIDHCAFIYYIPIPCRDDVAHLDWGLVQRIFLLFRSQVSSVGHHEHHEDFGGAVGPLTEPHCEAAAVHTVAAEEIAIVHERVRIAIELGKIGADHIEIFVLFLVHSRTHQGGFYLK